MLSTTVPAPQPSLNHAQMHLLNQTKQAGMTATILSFWTPYQSANGEQSPFSPSHGEAVLFLVNTLRVLPSQAVAEVSEITALEAALIPEFFRLGLNGAAIRENRNTHSFHEQLFHQALSFLTQKQKLSFQNAMTELENLNNNQLSVLLDLYRYGLRGKNLRNLRGADAAYELYISSRDNTCKADSTARDAAKYFVKVFRAEIREHRHAPANALAEACREILKLKPNIQHSAQNDKSKMLGMHSSKRINFLLFNFNKGIRADDYPRTLTPLQKQTCDILRFYYMLDLPDALDEIQGMNDAALRLISKHYASGLYHRRLDSFPHDPAFINHFMKIFRWDVMETIDKLTPLSSDQLLYLFYLQPFGFTLEQLRTLKEDIQFSHTRRDAAIYFIKEMGHAPILAMQEVIVNRDDDLLEMMHSNLRQLKL